MFYIWPIHALPGLLRDAALALRDGIHDAVRAQVYPLGYVPSHDGMRGLMTLGVVTAHVSHTLVPGAVLYIDLFFVASAYYITGLLLRDLDKHGHIRFREFYARRFARIVPPLLLMLAAYLLFTWLLRPPFGPALERAAIALCYVANYWYVFDPKTIEDIGHTWTLSTEEQFYLLWPLTFALLVKRFGVSWRLVGAICAIAAAIWAWRVALVLDGAEWRRLYTAFDTRADALMAGCAMAVVLRLVPHGASPRLDRLWPKLAWPLLLYWGTVTFLFWPADGPSMNYYLFGSMVCGVLPGILVLTMLARSSGTILHRVFEWPVAILLGRIFYGIYLWHLPILNFLDSYGVWWPLRLAIGLPLSIIAATLSYALLERHFLRRRSPAVPPQAAQPNSHAAQVPMPASRFRPEPAAKPDLGFASRQAAPLDAVNGPARQRSMIGR
ncbi:putative Acyltransferase 3 [Bradyrhizobium sp. ORS 285]|uniref:acyltransferase family protein n=1 Tax=Bradyrhizobium sp. ORS 285 TaxID=115808 RepID=UPI0002405763|nr:acyltransferase [Bradyrhizobium sp. ORS 285]CCD90054.1 putative Acyltransferase 3 [Bradyrhizobium sp. ORS 285]SMX60472.1 putative Acyltransferase 3 [Bradyrhizobium sp. ORS 285]